MRPQRAACPDIIWFNCKAGGIPGIEALATHGLHNNSSRQYPRNCLRSAPQAGLAAPGPFGRCSSRHGKKYTA